MAESVLPHPDEAPEDLIEAMARDAYHSYSAYDRSLPWSKLGAYSKEGFRRQQRAAYRALYHKLAARHGGDSP